MYGKTNGKRYPIPFGTVSGTVKNAESGYTLSGVTISCSYYDLEGKYRSATTTTNSSGYYELEIVEGTRTISFSLTDYITRDISTSITRRRTTTLNVSLSPAIPTGTYRAILEWGSTPRDLDSHLIKEGDTSFHVYYSNKSQGTATLDTDCQQGYGPETITFTPTTSEGYRYYVYNWSNEGELAGCNAHVTLYNGIRLMGSYTIPTSGSGRYWHVFDYNHGFIRVWYTSGGRIMEEEPTW